MDKDTLQAADIETCCKIIKVFVHLKNNEHYNEYPRESFAILRTAIDNLETTLESECHEAHKKKEYQLILKEGWRVYNTSTILEPIRFNP